MKMTNDPEFSSPNLATITENNNLSVVFYQANASDMDIGMNAEFTYSISNVILADDSGNQVQPLQQYNNFFSIDPINGTLTANVALDREGLHSFRVLIAATDKGAVPQTGVLDLWVQVCELNDNSPIFSSKPEDFIFNLNENTANGVVVGTPLRNLTTDADLGAFCAEDTANAQDNVIVYELDTENVTLFTVRENGEIVVSGDIDYEQVQNATLEITGMDLGEPSREASVVVTINIIDLNDNAPVFDPSFYNTSVAENATLGTQLGVKVMVSDLDSGNNGAFDLALSGQGAQDFAIDSEGVIRIDRKLDRENQSIYMLTITATDKGSPSMNSTAELVINVVDINDSPPMFNQSLYTVTVSENIPEGTNVLTVVAEDGDVAHTRDITYSLAGSYAHFKIDNVTGRIYPSSPSCVDMNTTYAFMVIATDQPLFGLAFTATAAVQITVYDDNTATPTFGRAILTVFTPDNRLAGSEIGSVTATDADSCSALQYSITPVLDHASFSISESTGVLTTIGNLNTATEHLYQIIVKVVDTGSPIELSTTVTVYIIVGETIPVDFTSNGGFPVLPSTENGPEAYKQSYRYFQDVSDSNPGQLTTSFGSLSDSVSYLPSLLTATQMEAILVSTVVYYDNPVVTVIAQLLSTDGSDAVSPTQFHITITYNSQTTTNSTMTVKSFATASVEVPESWFNSAGQVIVSVNINGEAATPLTEQVTITPRPVVAEMCVPDAGSGSPPVSQHPSRVVAVIPSYTLYQDDVFPVEISTVSNESSILALVIQCTAGDGVSFSDSPAPVLADSDNWEMKFAVSTSGNSITVQATRQEGQPSLGEQDIMTLYATVTSNSASIISMTCSVVDSVDQNGETSSYNRVQVIGRDGCNVGNQLLYVSTDSLVGIFVHAPQRIVYNTAIFSGTADVLELRTTGVYASSPPHATRITTGLACNSTNEAILRTNAQCLSVVTDGSETAGSEDVQISVSTGSFTKIISVQVYYPDLPLQLFVADTVLNRITDLFEGTIGNCSSTGAYQRTTLSARTTYRPSPASTSTAPVIVDQYIDGQVQSLSTDFAVVNGLQIIGILGGGTSIIRVARPGRIFGDITVEVSADQVNVIDMNVFYTKSVTASVPNDISYTDPADFTAQLDRDFEAERQTAELVSFAVFNDGYTQKLSSNDVVYSSENTSILTVSGASFSVLANGQGDLLTATWRNCLSNSIFDDPNSLDISLPQGDIIISLSEAGPLVHSSDAAANIGSVSRAVGTNLTVTLRYDSMDTSLDITDAADYDIQPSNLLTMTTTTSGARLLQVASSTVSGQATVTVRYKHNPPATITILVERSISTSALASIYPIAQGSPSPATLTLNRISVGGAYQKAELSALLSLSSGSTIDVGQVAQYTATPSSVVSISGNIVTPQTVGQASIIASLPGVSLPAVPVIVDATNTLLVVTSIENVELSTGGTLSGAQGSVGAMLRATLRFSGGSELDAFSTISQTIPLNVVSNAPSVFTVNQSTGAVTILDNYPEQVSLTISSGGNTASLSFYCNLDAGVGEVDLGNSTGAPIMRVLSSVQVINVPVRVNVGTSELGAVDVAVGFDGSALTLRDVRAGEDWTGPWFASSELEFDGFLHLGGVSSTGLTGTVEIAILEFQVNTASYTGIRASVVTLLDNQTPPTSIRAASSPAANVTVFRTSPAPSTFPEITLNLNALAYSVNQCTTPPCSCSTAETGDLSGDCVFDIADALHLYQNETLTQGDCVNNAVDVNLDGRCDNRDIGFLTRANFHQVFFVKSITVSPVVNTFCFFRLQASMTGRGEASPIEGQDYLLFGFLHRNSDFQAQFDGTVPYLNQGMKTAWTGAEVPSSANGGFFVADKTNETIYEVSLETLMSEPDVSLVIVQAHRNSLNQITREQVIIMTGPRKLPEDFPEYINSQVTIAGSDTVTFEDDLGFSALLTFNQSFSSADCINNGRPVFFPRNTSISIYENATAGSVAAVVFANDTDAGPNALINYFFTMATPEILSAFEINQTSGEVYVKTIDREMQDYYLIGLLAQDQGPVAQLDGYGTLEIHILDVNDNAPQFGDVVYNIAQPIPESIPVNTIIATVNASDADLGNNAEFSYAISPSEPRFSVNIVTGEISVAQSLDHETAMSYNLTIIAKDNGSPSLTGTVYVPIQISPVNDNPPDCNPNNRLALLPEDHLNGTDFYIVNVRDIDQGANHSVLSYSMAPTDRFNIRKLSDMQAAIYTTVDNFDRGVTPEYNVMVTVTDAGGLSCSIDLVVRVAEPSRFDFAIQGDGYLSGSVRPRASADGYNREIAFFPGTLPSGTVTGRLGTLSDEASYEKMRQPPTVIRTILHSTEIWFDNPVVTGVSQQRDSLFSTATEPAAVSLAIALVGGTGSVITGSPCRPADSTGLCDMSVFIPPEWFTSGAMVNVTAQWLPSYSEFLGTVTLNSAPSVSLPTADNLLIQTPAYPVYRGSMFPIWISGSTGVEITGFQLDINTTGDVLLQAPSDRTWGCETRLNTPSYVFVCFKRDSSAPATTVFGTHRMLAIPAVSSSTVDVSIRGTVRSLSGRFGTIVSTSKPAWHIDSDGQYNKTDSTVMVQDPNLRGIFSVASSAVNTAPITDQPVPVPLTVYGVWTDSTPPYTDVTGSSSCSSTSPALTVTNCQNINLEASHATGTPQADIIVQRSPFSITQSLMVWYPVTSSVRMTITDTVLNRIDYDASSCNGIYQTAKVHVYARFTTGSQTSREVEVLNPSIIAEESQTIAVSGNELMRGTATTMGALNTDVWVNQYKDTTTQVVTTTNTPVTVYSVNPTIIRSLEVAVAPSTYSTNSSLTASVVFDDNFNHVDVSGYVTGFIYFSDGARMDVDLVTVSSSNERIAMSSNMDRFTTVASGNVGITTHWQPLCASTPVINSTTPLRVLSQPGASLEIMVDSTRIAQSGNGSVLGAPESTPFSVIASFDDGTRFDVTSVVVLSTTGSICWMSTPNYQVNICPAASSPISDGMLTASYQYAPDTPALTSSISFTALEQHTSGAVSAGLLPYPTPVNTTASSSITLRRYSGTTCWQRARLQIRALLSDDSNTEVPFKNNYLDTTISNISVIDNGVIAPTQAGSFVIATNFGNTLSVMVLDNMTDISVTSIDSVSLTSTGAANQMKLTIAATFSDGSSSTDVMATNPCLINSLINVAIQPTGVASFNASTGIVQVTNSNCGTSFVNVTSGSAANAASFIANVIPGLGELDIGESSGVAQEPVSINSTFTTEVRIRVDDKRKLSAIDYIITYDSASLALVSIDQELSAYTEVRTFSPDGAIQVSGVTIDEFDEDEPVVARIQWRAIRAGVTVVASRVNVAADSSLNNFHDAIERKMYILVQGSGAVPSNTASPAVVYDGGDTNGDSLLDAKDAASTISYLTGQGPTVDDTNFDGQTNSYDVIFLLRAASRLIPVLKFHPSVTPVGSNTMCSLIVTASTSSIPASQAVFFVLSHEGEDFQLYLNATEIMAGNTTKQVIGQNGIFEAVLTNSTIGMYTAALDTPIDYNFPNVGLSIITITVNAKGTTYASRVSSYIRSSPASSFNRLSNLQLVSSQRGFTMNNVVLGEEKGLIPLRTFNNSIRSDFCDFSGSTIRIYVPEDQMTDIVFHNISAIASGFPDDDETYEIVIPSIPFEINSNGGLSLNGQLDYDEGQQSYVFNVSLIYSPVPPNQLQATVIVNVTDVNDNAPTFSQPSYDFSFSEITPVETTLAVVSASDIDSGMNAMFEFTIEPSSDPRSQFAINATTGEVVLVNSLDRETTAVHNVTILATDFGEPRMTGTAQLIINVLDVNDNAPMFGLDDFVLTILEDIYKGSDVFAPMATVNVSDPDFGENATITLSLIINETFVYPNSSYSNPAGLFDIADNGTIIVTGSLDREEVDRYSFTVLAVDGGNPAMNSTVSLTIVVGDVNDNAPIFVEEGGMHFVEEDLVVGTVIVQLLAEDRDIGSNANITYEIIGEAPGFEIDPVTGEFRVAPGLSISADLNQIFVIRARDNGVPRMNDTTDIMVTIIEGQLVRFNITRNGFLVESPERVDQQSYSQGAGYIFGADIGAAVDVSGRIGTADSRAFENTNIANPGGEPTQVNGRVLQDRVYHSQRTVTVFIRAADDRGVVAISKRVRVEIVPSALLEALSNQRPVVYCTTSLLGYCIARVPIPDQWFERNTTSQHFVTVYVATAVDTGPGREVRKLDVQAAPSHAPWLTPNPIFISPPSHPVYPSTSFGVEIFIISPLAGNFYTRFTANVLSPVVPTATFGQGFSCSK